MGTSRPARSLLLVAVLALGLSIVYLALTPPWQIPDEPQHYQLARLVADRGRWPVLSDVWAATDLERQVYASLVRNRFWEIRANRTPPPSLWADTAPDVLLPPIAAPPGYYIVAAGALRLKGSSSAEAGLYAMRLLSALLGLLELVLIWVMARAVFPSDPWLSAAALAFVGFLPMRACMTAGANSDMMAALAAAAALCAMVRWIAKPLTPARGAVLGLLLALALLTKRTTLFLLPAALLFLILNRRAQASAATNRPLRWWISAGLGAMMLCAPLAAWMLARPPLLVPGQVWPYPGSAPDSLLGVRPEWLARLFSSEAWTWSALAGYARSMGIAFASFWGAFGWLTVPLGVGWYVALAALTAAGIAGLLRRMRREGSALAPAQVLIIGAAVLAVLLIVGAAVAQGVPQQGRYLLPAAGPIACGLAMGWAGWLPQRKKRLLPLAVGGVLLLLNAVAWLFYMRPAFYGR